MAQLSPLVRRERPRGGFSLLEVMIALTLLGIGLLSLAAMQITALEFGGRGRHMTRAAAIAEGEMEKLQRRSWGDLLPTAWTAPDVRNEDSHTYEVSHRITNVVAGSTRSIDVRVTWDEPGRANRSYALSSMRFNHEGL